MEAIHFNRYNFHGYVINIDTVVVTWIVLAIASIVLIILRSKLSVYPGKLQTILEVIVDFFDQQAVSMMGPKGKEFTPIIFFIFIVVLMFNWVGLLPGDLKVNGILIFAPPTRDINTTFSLAICSFLIFNFFGFAKKGLGYFKNFIHPIPEVAASLPLYFIWIVPPLTLLFLVLNILEMFARVLSLTIRLFGNVMGEHIVAVSLITFTLIVLKLFVIAGIATYILPIFVFFLGIITGAVQAFVFAILTMAYISTAVAQEH